MKDIFSKNFEYTFCIWLRIKVDKSALARLLLKFKYQTNPSSKNPNPVTQFRLLVPKLKSQFQQPLERKKDRENKKQKERRKRQKERNK